jgi:putative hemolysin
MRNFIGLGMALCGCVACTTPVASQPVPADPLNGTTTTSSAPSSCTMVNGTADIDGTTQNISGLACKQPDGTWQIQQQDTGVYMGDVYPPPAYPYYPYYDPWFYGPPAAFGFGASFVFVDRFHHFHHMDHARFGPHVGFGSRGAFHGAFRGGSGFHGGGFHGGGGGHR